METNNKPRKALAEILGVADHVQMRFEIPKLANQEISELKQIAEAALAEPVKNCEVGTAKEQVKRWRRFCDSMTTCGECPCHKSYSEVVTDCFSRWAQMPYESEAAK